MDQREAFKLSDLSQLSRTQGHSAFFARSSLCVESSNLSFNLNMIKAFSSNHPQPRSIFWPFRPFSDRRRLKISLLFKRYLRLGSGCSAAVKFKPPKLEFAGLIPAGCWCYSMFLFLPLIIISLLKAWNCF